ncbi:MAG: hypothetical protein QXW40_08200 [Thermofilum sp.]
MSERLAEIRSLLSDLENAVNSINAVLGLSEADVEAAIDKETTPTAAVAQAIQEIRNAEEILDTVQKAADLDRAAQVWTDYLQTAVQNMPFYTKVSESVKTTYGVVRSTAAKAPPPPKTLPAQIYDTMLELFELNRYLVYAALEGAWQMRPLDIDRFIDNMLNIAKFLAEVMRGE